MATAIFRKRGRAFVPVDQEGLDALSAIRDERDVEITIKQRRNPRQHRLLFALLKFTVEHTDLFTTTEEALLGLKIACGLVDPYIDAESGKTFFVPRSISFASMEQGDFAAFFDRAIYVITERWMPEGTTPESVRAEIETMVALPNSPSIAPDPERSDARELATVGRGDRAGGGRS